MAINSRAKGAAGERELSHKSNGDADVVGLPGIHIECKRVERLNIYDAMSQAKHDTRPGELPAVFHRKNHCEWLVTLTLDDFMTLYREGGMEHGNINS